MLDNLSSAKKISLLTGIFVILFGSLLAVYWVLNPNYVQLTRTSDASESETLVNALIEKGIGYELSEHGQAIAVPESAYEEALLGISSVKGKDHKSNGLELYDTVEYGLTEHTQKVTYQRAIQGELERTLSQFSFIDSARVHITPAEKKLFKTEQDRAKAAVKLMIVDKHQMTYQQVITVKQLISSSVDQLDEKDVSVFDQFGQSLGNRALDSIGLYSNVSANIESTKQNKIESVLSLYFNKQQYSVTVSAVVDKTKTKTITQAVLPVNGQSGLMVRKKESISEKSTDGEQDDQQSNLEIEYAHTKQTKEVIYAPEKLQRLSVAVALLADIDDNQLKELTRLIGTAVGIDEQRGDVLTVNVFTPLENLSPPLVEEESVSSSFVPNPTSTEISRKDELGLEINPIWYGLALLIFITSNILMFAVGKQKRLSAQEKQALLVEVNQAVMAKR
ncbi:hypothetical protein HR060_10995 [Catenovulum sp. SM1970]|uniref:flagellar M-ring protein FliF C-terminal domain-containing protein n=1 Tax=Marinifaba aquimaris TaxID=2741323 RepID=UPI001571B9A3|nr:flagellar M-ring protein FliF C-terminal domain-containing protein [Marinifaba aquimaris]NTS77386.1 hypothetical protein [Marinifaba aquimaris]